MAENTQDPAFNEEPTEIFDTLDQSLAKSKECGDYYRDLSLNYDRYKTGPSFLWPDRPAHCPVPYVIDSLQ